ncbi:MAG: hypothetical protein AB8B80_10280 [Marinicellaceae bacterium]
MKYLKNILILTCLLISTFVNAQTISDYLTGTIYSLNVDHFTSGDDLVLHNELVIDNISGIDGIISADNIFNIRGAKVDGFHSESEGLRHYSFDADTRIGATVIFKSDIVICNDDACSAPSLFFSAAAESMKGVNINAFTIDPDNGELLFSIESAATIDGIGYLPGDIIRYSSDGDFSLEYNSFSASGGFALNRNIDGLTLLPNGYYLVSFVNEVARNYIYEYHPPSDSWDVAYTPLGLGNNGGSLNINSLMGFENDLIFKNGFQ